MAVKRSQLFLFASFLSSIGDTLLVFALPVGLGIETQDIRTAVLMWLIPSLAMFSASFLNNRISSRSHRGRKDYATLLLAIAAIEIIIAILANIFLQKEATVILVTLFVFFYAFAKEGIPRILYNVTVYKYFANENEYASINGKNSALTILASIVGAFLAAYLVQYGSWRLALVIDAVSFVVLGLIILVSGRDPEPTEYQASQSTLRPGLRDFKAIAFAVPVIFGANALLWNYLPLIAEKRGIALASSSIVWIAMLRLPGLLSGLCFHRIISYVSESLLVRILPALYILSLVHVALHPTMVSIAILICIQGFLPGLYWPADNIIRSRLAANEMVSFNTLVLRRLSVFQFFCSIAAIYMYKPGQEAWDAVPFVMATVAIASVALAANLRK